MRWRPGDRRPDDFSDAHGVVVHHARKLITGRSSCRQTMKSPMSTPAVKHWGPALRSRKAMVCLSGTRNRHDTRVPAGMAAASRQRHVPG